MLFQQNFEHSLEQLIGAIRGQYARRCFHFPLVALFFVFFLGAIRGQYGVSEKATCRCDAAVAAAGSILAGTSGGSTFVASIAAGASVTHARPSPVVCRPRPLRRCLEDQRTPASSVSTRNT